MTEDRDHALRDVLFRYEFPASVCGDRLVLKLTSAEALQVIEGVTPDNTGHPVDNEPLADQVERLARFIAFKIPGEPSQSQGAVDTAIRLLRDAYTEHI